MTGIHGTYKKGRAGFGRLLFLDLSVEGGRSWVVDGFQLGGDPLDRHAAFLGTPMYKTWKSTHYRMEPGLKFSG